MKILFAYFDFSDSADSQYPRSLGECELNFSTTHNYRVEKKATGDEGREGCVGHKYTVSRDEKPKDECIPIGFWGKRIYNVTAIVGANGSGKSTILHNMIRAVVRGLKPEVPFALVLQMSGADDLHLYCSDDSVQGFCWDECDELQTPVSMEYPVALMRTKTMLLDNTLSPSALELDEEYSRYCLSDEERRATPSIMLKPVIEDTKQFYNKSQVASIRYSIAISLAGRYKEHVPVSDSIESHFRYETYQETRCLFDRFYRESLFALEDEGTEGFSVPMPKYLDVSIMKPASMNAALQQDFGTTYQKALPPFPKACRSLEEYGFIGMLLSDALLNYYVNENKEMRKSCIYDAFSVDAKNLQTATHSDSSDIAVQLANKVLQGIDGSDAQAINRESAARLKDIRAYVEFVAKNRQTLIGIFHHEVATEPNAPIRLYRIDMDAVVSDESKQTCIIRFLDFYRPVSDPCYFLVFSSGMSSGEKNFLRMLTQFRYLLSGPAVYANDASKENTGCRLMNVLDARSPNPYDITCNTLFLILDEADLTYHPEWQRIFVSKLTSVLPRMFRNPYNESEPDEGCKDIQIFLATHSPLMLGDFPKASINYLPSGGQTSETVDLMKASSIFGENLYTILRHSFFMEQTIGEFARQKIEAAARWCADVRANKEDAAEEYQAEEYQAEEYQAHYDTHYDTVRLLPKGIIRSKLEAELEECARIFGFDSSHVSQDNQENMARRIEESERRIEELQRELNRKNAMLREAGMLGEQDS